MVVVGVTTMIRILTSLFGFSSHILVIASRLSRLFLA
jgi:hypothetical protein